MGSAPLPQLFDMHCHLDFSHEPAKLLRSLQDAGIGCFWNTVTPRDFLTARTLFANQEPEIGGVGLGVGLHPWWIADGTLCTEDVDLAVELCAAARYVGEVGLDFAPRREGTFELQLDAFERIVRACAPGGKTLSIHAVKSAQTVLDVLEANGATRGNACIFHWFSGSGDELARAVRLGCWFSLGTRSLSTKRGRAYARNIPADRLLLETDWPNDPNTPLEACPSAAEWRQELECATRLLAQARGVDETQMTFQLTSNARTALGLEP